MKFRTVLFSRATRFFTLLLIASLMLPIAMPAAKGQDTVTGAFEGNVTHAQTGVPIAGASVQFINQSSGVPIAKRSDAQGHFYQGLLPPGTYLIRVSAAGYQTREIELRLVATRSNTVVPVPVTLSPEIAATPTPVTTGTPEPTSTPSVTPQTSAQATTDETSILAEINIKDARRGGAFTEQEVSTLPLGGRTLVRSFDELALLLPGVAAPPQAIGNGTGPGVGAGVGTSGQFSVNGLRSRANNFTVDGSDNNDEDIGVRRQGFFTLIPQPIESIQEFQVITLLAPAQFGRNLGAQVNAISKSGGNQTHGTIFGFFNSSQLNAPDAFDTTSGNTRLPLQGRRLNANGTLGEFRNVFINNNQAFVSNTAGAEDSFTLAQGGFVIGGPLMPNKLFYFISAEGQLLNATKESNFAVPTVEQRGAFRSGATGITVDPLTGTALANPDFPTAATGDAFFSLFPFPNNPNGIYGRNTFTQALPASAQGKVVSGKLDYNFKVRERQQSFTARYNFTDDWRDIPVTGGALFSRLRPRVRTQNFSTFLNSELSGPNSGSPVFNQLRLSYGRTRLKFDEGRDTDFLLPTQANGLQDDPFLLNAPFLLNSTLPNSANINYGTFINFDGSPGTTENAFDCATIMMQFVCQGYGIGPIGQLNMAGFSPVGVDVFNFPQRRVNNTYQLADTLTWQTGDKLYTFGADIRRTELNSDLPRNSRPLVTFNGAPRIVCADPPTCNNLRFANANDPNPFIRPEDFAAAAAPSGFFQSLALSGQDAAIHLRYYQLNFFGQMDWRVRSNLSISAGIRYEFNTSPREADRRIESTFNDPALSLVPGLSTFIAGRNSIFETQHDNFAPRIGFAYSPNWFGSEHTTVIRAGYGLFFDQILGAVVSQSRNVFPTFSTINFGGGCIANIPGGCPTLSGIPLEFNVFNPIQTSYFVPGQGLVPIVQPGTLNTLNPLITLNNLVNTTNVFFGGSFGSSFGETLPTKRLDTPFAHHYSISFEQELSRNMVVSAAYVGTLGRNLLRSSTPNLGQNLLIVPLAFNSAADPILGGPSFSGVALDPGFFSDTGGRPVANVGAINRFETTASSRYDALQLQARGRFSRRFQYQVAYTWSKATDDVSDVFDLAGASALPQNSRTLAGERGPANFDTRHRISYNLNYELPEYKDKNAAFRLLFGGLQITSSGFFHTGQPFTVNSIFDVNLDGNLTDRLDNTNGIRVTGDRSHPLELTTANTFSLLAPVGQDGSIPRNSFRAGNVMELDLSFIKKFAITESKGLTFRMDIYNFTDRANYGIPVRFLEAPGFGRATDTVTPGRRIQFGLKYTF